jgi:hypothetical protein
MVTPESDKLVFVTPSYMSSGEGSTDHCGLIRDGGRRAALVGLTHAGDRTVAFARSLFVGRNLDLTSHLVLRGDSDRVRPVALSKFNSGQPVTATIEPAVEVFSDRIVAATAFADGLWNMCAELATGRVGFSEASLALTAAVNNAVYGRLSGPAGE